MLELVFFEKSYSSAADFRLAVGLVGLCHVGFREIAVGEVEVFAIQLKKLGKGSGFELVL
jgi:hypothetical protein